MSAILEQLGIDRMTVLERIALAREILDSVAADQPRAPLFEAKRRDVDRSISEHQPNPIDGVLAADVDLSITTDQEVQRRLFAAGLLGEIKPSVRIDAESERFRPIVIQGEPLSEMIIRERR